MTTELTNEQINEEFCKEVGLKKVSCYIENEDTGEVRFYVSPSGVYKKPKGWNKIKTHKFEQPKYPDLINNPYNFSMLLNTQWYIFGQLGDVYTKTGHECFEANYVKTRLKALKMCKCLGGGEMLEEYKKAIQSTQFDFLEEE